MNVLHALTVRALDRAAKWQPVPVTNLPDPETLTEIALLGSYSYSLPQSRRRLIRGTLPLEDEVRETPTAIGRDYLREIYKTGPKGTARQLENVAACPPVPNVAHPDRFSDGAYIDIRACYWSIMLIVGWNVDYNPGLWLSPGRPPFDFPFADHHVARDCLVSSGRAAMIPRYDPRKRPNDPYDEIKAGNSLMNMQLVRLIHDVLNGIGWLCLKEGAIYLNNDGMIVPTPRIADRCAGIITDWGLKYTIKGQGSGEVKASGTYRVGMTTSATYHLQRHWRPLELIFPVPYLRWLQSEFSYFAAGILN